MKRMIQCTGLVLAVISLIVSLLTCSSGLVMADSGKTVLVPAPALSFQPLEPPAGFAPLAASDEDLAKYGLPPRPTDPAALETWNSAMACAKTYMPSSTTVATGELGLTGLATTEKRHSFWCGYANSPYNNKQGSIIPKTYPGTGNPNEGICYASFKLPTTIPTGNGIAAFWTGYSDGVQIDQAAVCVGTNIPAQGGYGSICALVQNFPSLPIWVQFSMSPGDDIYINVHPVDKYNTICTFIDMTKGTYTTQGLTISPYQCPSVYSQVDFIYEAYQGVSAYPTAWGSTDFWECGFKAITNGVVTFPYVDQWNNYRYTMKTTYGHIYGTASGLNSATHGFSVTSYP